MYWINRAIVLRAKVLLHTSNQLTYEIADRLHFASYLYSLVASIF